MLNDLDLLLILALNRHLDKKAMKKLVLKLMKRAHPRLRRGLLDSIMNAKDHGPLIDAAIAEMELVEELTQDFIREGHHGMVLVAGQVVPVVVDFNDTETGEDESQWLIENEDECSITAAEYAMNRMDPQSYLRCTVVLFSEVGFSGRARDWAMQRQLSSIRTLEKMRKSA